jgi:hypothetical protein
VLPQSNGLAQSILFQKLIDKSRNENLAQSIGGAALPGNWCGLLPHSSRAGKQRWFCLQFHSNAQASLSQRALSA